MSSQGSYFVVTQSGELRESQDPYLGSLLGIRPRSSSSSSAQPPSKIRRTMPYVKKPYKARGPSRKGVKKAFTRMQTEVSRTKYIDVTTSEFVVNTLASFATFDWAQIPAGTANNSRTGNDVLCTALGFSAVYNNNNGAGGSVVRELLLEVDGGKYHTNTEVLAKLFEGPTDTTESGGLSDIVAKVNREGLRVLHDRVITLPADSAGSDQNGMVMSKIYRKYTKRLHFEESSTDQPVNKRYVMFICNRDPANDSGNLNLEVTINRQLWFKDV